FFVVWMDMVNPPHTRTRGECPIQLPFCLENPRPNEAAAPDSCIRWAHGTAPGDVRGAWWLLLRRETACSRGRLTRLALTILTVLGGCCLGVGGCFVAIWFPSSRGSD